MELPLHSLRYKRQNASTPELVRDDAAAVNFVSALSVVGVVLSAVITLIIVARLMPQFVDSVADVNENLTSEEVTFGDETTDGIKPVFAIVVGLSALVGLVALIIGAFVRFRGA